MIKHYWDEKDGGFFFTSDDAEELIVRNKVIYDGATPSGNSVAMYILLRIARLSGNTEFEKKATQISQFFSEQIIQAPQAFTMFMTAYDFALGPTAEVVIVGKPQADDTEKMINSIRKKYIPNKVILFRSSLEDSPEITKISTYTKDLSTIDDKATVFVCHNYLCEQPTTDIDEMIELLEEA